MRFCGRRSVYNIIISPLDRRRDWKLYVPLICGKSNRFSNEGTLEINSWGGFFKYDNVKTMFSIRLLKLIHARNIEFNTSKLLQISYRNWPKKFRYCIFLLGVSIEKTWISGRVRPSFRTEFGLARAMYQVGVGQLFDRADPRGFIFRDWPLKKYINIHKLHDLLT